MLNAAHITASPSFGGPERQMLPLALLLQEMHCIKFHIASFWEGGNAEAFLNEVKKSGIPAYRFQNDFPHLVAALREYVRYLKENRISIVFAHGHKARILGWLAARWLKIPIIGVSHGWTGENARIKVFERVDKWMHHRMNHVVCVSQGQADKVLKYGMPQKRLSVIHNSVDTRRFDAIPDGTYRQKMESFFPRKPKRIIASAGRLSPEKGFDVLLNAFAQLLKEGKISAGEAGLVIFGTGFLKDALQRQIQELELTNSAVLAGYTSELDRFMPHFDVYAQSSHSEGMPVVLLEAMAARVAVVATEVGGTNEVVLEGETGLMVPANDVPALANALEKALNGDAMRQSFGENGRKRAAEHFTFAQQAESYWQLLNQFIAN